MTTNVALYARYSSEHQNPRSIEDQLQHLRRHIAQSGGQPETARAFSDAETSGAIWERPGLQSLLGELEASRIAHVFVEDVSRISRDPEDLARLRKLFAFHGARLVSVDDGIELDGSSGSALAFGVKSMLSEQYLKDLGAKTKRGLMGNAREGKNTGGRAYGYHADAQTKQLEVVRFEATTVRRIFKLYAEGASYDRIASTLNRERIEPPRARSRRAGGGWMSSCIREMLRNPKYIGRWSFGQSTAGTRVREGASRATGMTRTFSPPRDLSLQSWSVTAGIASRLVWLSIPNHRRWRRSVAPCTFSRVCCDAACAARSWKSPPGARTATIGAPPAENAAPARIGSVSASR